jgi:hypothetical protein
MSDRRIEIEGTVITPAEPAAAAAAETPTPAAASDGASRMRRLVAALVLLNVALIAALASAPYWAPRFGGGSGGADVTALQAKIDALQGRLAEADQTRQRLAAAEQRLAGVEARGTTGATPRDAQQAQIMGQLADRLAILEQRVASVDTTSGNAAAVAATKSLESETQALAHRLDDQAQALSKVQTSQAQSPDRTDAALLLAVDRLHQAIQTSRPYDVELATATALARDRPEALAALTPLQARAARGVPSLAVLAERLELLAPALTSAAATPADDDWRSQMLAKVKSLVSVRRVGSRAAAEGGDVEVALAEAEAALKAGDLAGAVAAMRKLDGAAAETAKPWLGDAEARLAAETGVDALDAALARRFLGDQPAKP